MFIRPVAERGTFGRCNGKRIRVSPRLLPIIEKSIHVTGSSSGTVRVIGVMAPAAMVLFTVVVSEFDWYPFSSKAVKRIVPLTVVGQRKPTRSSRPLHPLPIRSTVFELDVDRIAPLRKYRSSCRIRQIQLHFPTTAVGNSIRSFRTFSPHWFRPVGTCTRST